MNRDAIDTIDDIDLEAGAVKDLLHLVHVLSALEQRESKGGLELSSAAPGLAVLAEDISARVGRIQSMAHLLWDISKGGA